MKLIVGLGNPGRQYERTRHNVGFRVVEELARRWGIEVTRRQFHGLIGSGCVGDQRVLLLKPMTYMNRSGQSVREAMTFHKLGVEDVLVLTDDLALPLGRLRIRRRGTAGGHHGLDDIIAEVGSEEFARLRVGIDDVQGSDAVQYVLGGFSEEEERRIGPAIARAADAVECCLAEGVEAAMNRFNRPEEEAGG